MPRDLCFIANFGRQRRPLLRRLAVCPEFGGLPNFRLCPLAVSVFVCDAEERPRGIRFPPSCDAATHAARRTSAICRTLWEGLPASPEAPFRAGKLGVAAAHGVPSVCLFHGLSQVSLLRRCARRPVRLRRRAVSVRSRPDVCSTVFRSSYFSAGALRVPSVCGAVPSRSAPVRMPVPRSFAGLTSPSVRTASRPSAAPCRLGPHAGSAEATGRR